MGSRIHGDQFSFLMLMTLILAGCSSAGDRPEVGKVAGRITINGEALSGVIVSFMPEVGRAATGMTDEDGRYKLTYLEGVEGCKLGPNTVAVMASTGGKSSHSIPTKYQQNSPLNVVVLEGENTFDFDLEMEPSKGKSARNPSRILD